jgi:hypothetical protein
MATHVQLGTETPAGPADSPSLCASGEAIELKYLLSIDAARRVETWARDHLPPDPHGVAGLYHTTSLYCDTPCLDIFYGSPGHRRSKYRVRRYGDGCAVHLERKTKKGGCVRKRRESIPLEALPAMAAPEDTQGGSWFHHKVRFHDLRPVCRIAYNRTAFIGTAPEGALRLTLDRDPIGVPAQDWELPPLYDGHNFLSDSVILELKFHASLPLLFRRLLAELPSNTAKASKYRLCLEALGIARRV